MTGGCTERDGRPSLSDSVEKLAHRADSRGAVRRAGDLRAVAEHLRAKEAGETDRVGDVVDVRPQPLAPHRRGAARRPRLPALLHRAGQRVRRLVTR